MDNLISLHWLISPHWLPVLLGPFAGSFLGVLIDRLPAARPIALARSECERCGHRLGPVDLVPLLSYLLSRGRCRYCRQPIGGFPLMIEIAATLVAVWAALAPGDTPIWWSCLLGWTLLTLGWIDARTMLLPDVLTLPLVLAGLVMTQITQPDLVADHALAAVLGYASLFATAWIYRRVRGRDGLGMGDAKLLAAIGAWVGLGALPIVLFLAAILGLLAAGAAAVTGKRMTAASAIPFGPFLAAAGWLAWLYYDWATAL